MKIGVFPGSFCPITKGHLNIIERASKLVDTLFVAVLNNATKHYSISYNDRVELIKMATKDIPNVKVEYFSGTMADFCCSVNADVIIKSGRNAIDLQYEMDMAEINKEFCGIETIYLACDKEFSSYSSTIVRELVNLNKDITSFVPNGLAEKIKDLLK